MASQNLFILKSYFGFVNERFLSEFLYRTLFRYGNSLWGSLCSFMLSIFWFIAKFIPRLKPDFKPQEDDDQVVSLSSKNLEPEEKGSSEFYFSFLHQESKDSHENFVEKTDGLAFQQSKYQFLSGKNVCQGFVVQKPETMRFTVQEMFVGSSVFTISNDQNLDLESTMSEHVEEGTNSGEKVAQFDEKVDKNLDLGSAMNEEVKEGSDTGEKVAEFDSEIASICSIEEHTLAEESPSMNETFEVKQKENLAGNKVIDFEDINDLGDYSMEDDDISYEVQLLPSPEFSVKPRNLDVQYGGLFDEILKPEIIEDIAEGSDSEYIELEPDSKNTINYINEEVETLDEDEFIQGNRMNSEDDGLERLRLEKEFWESYDSEDEDEDDILWEHQQLVQQKKMEMKNSKIKALPTISEEEEECETPKMMEEDLKPLKIEPKFEYKDLLEEIHKFYKSYAEKMRKLDILNYQSLNAINIAQFKDSRVFVSSKKASFPHIKRLSSPSLWIGKQKRIFADISITEMQRDLELVYIGQVCLSWEILRWQYGKLKLLLEYDSQGHHSYNLVAGEYQQLQVLLQRFLEDEPFHGPRIQHYVKSRCFCRSLLQVPMIKDDCFKDKKDKLIEEQYAISVIELADIIRESMQVFSEFIRADNKDETSRALKGVKGSPADHPDPAYDLELLINIRICLEKKERKLKEIQRSANCIVKKFQKHQSSGRPSSGMFISQVELKLVSRVLNSSRLTTDQLLWCQKKLNNINIVNRKVHVEPVFLLFPC